MHNIINPKPLQLEHWQFERMFTPHHVSYVICFVSRVTCHIYFYFIFGLRHFYPVGANLTWTRPPLITVSVLQSIAWLNPALLFNRQGVAWAVIQTSPSFTDWLIKRFILFLQMFKTPKNPKPRPEMLTQCSPPVTCHVSHIQALTISINYSWSIFGRSLWNIPIFGWGFGFGGRIQHIVNFSLFGLVH